MASKKFRFVSPGVQLREIDRSQIPTPPQVVGPVIVGRAQRGPALTPVRVDNFSEFTTVFGQPQPGGSTSDVWRQGNEGLAPTYGAYAAQAFLASGTPLTYVRLLGRSHALADSTDAAQAGWKVGGDGTTNAGGAFGLFLVDSGSNADIPGRGGLTGTLASVWYCKSGCEVLLSGTTASGIIQVSGTCVMIGNSGKSAKGGSWTVLVTTGSTTKTVVERKQFSFNSTAGDFIRNQFNTNPTVLNSRITPSAQRKPYFLGESYESRVVNTVVSGAALNKVYGVILPLAGGADYDVDYNVNQADSNSAATGWIVGQDTGPAASFSPDALKRLFRVVALEEGEWANGNLKISIEDIRYSNNPEDKFGTFTLSVRRAQDSDIAPQIIESFPDVNLNPQSSDYICARIGDQYSTWDDTERSWRTFGDYENQSKYIYIKPTSDLGSEPGLIPFGYQGPLRPVGITLASGTRNDVPRPLSLSASAVTQTQKYNPSAIPLMGTGVAGRCANGTPTLSGGTAIIGMKAGMSASFEFPASSQRNNTAESNLNDPTDAYWGLATTGSKGRFDQSYVDLARGIPGLLNHGLQAQFGPTMDRTTNATEYSYVFTLDNISRTSVAGTVTAPHHFEAYAVSGARKSLSSISYSGSIGEDYGEGSYKDTLDDDFNRFTVPMFGGFDGTDIRETNPFNNYYAQTTPSMYNSYKYNSVKQAIDSCADPELVECNLMAMPGIGTTNKSLGLTNHLLDTCQRRADVMGVIDIEGGYQPPPDRADFGEDSDPGNQGKAATAASSLKSRQINNSYGACYYPWIQVKDAENGQIFFAPPSIAAMGTYAYSQAKSELWFAPAGFTRGGLTEGAGGIPIIGVTERLTSKDRDKLYENNINPIAAFPAEGLVMFGQKTLQATRSALDRINVRRLMIHIKKEISRIAARLLFDPNTQVTWDRFTGQAAPFLESVKVRLGLEDYKVMLDRTTTTPDLIDRNIMYAKIFLKPTRAIEFIAIDFVITNTGASFED